MIWVVLAVLGVPLWLIVGALAGAYWSRRKFQKAPGVFPSKLRVVSGDEGEGKWPRRMSHARWVHDVLLVHSGMALVRYEAVPVAGMEGKRTPAPDLKLKGEGPVSIRLRLDDNSLVEVGAPASAVPLLSGPFSGMPESERPGVELDSRRSA